MIDGEALWVEWKASLRGFKGAGEMDSSPADVHVSKPILAGEAETNDERFILAYIHFV